MKTSEIMLGMIVLLLLIFIIWMIFFGGWETVKDYLKDYNIGDGDGNGDEEELPCSEYDISMEFRHEFGRTAINNAESTCDDLGGEWTEEYDEISCWFPPIGEFDCDDIEGFPAIDDAEELCEDGLYATWLCDEDLAYIGCYCKYDYDVPEYETDRCEDSYPHCDGTCSSGQWCRKVFYGDYLLWDESECVCDEDYLNSDCDDMCMDYGYDYGDKAHSPYDCEIYEDYIDGCCCGYMDGYDGDGIDCDTLCVDYGYSPYGGYDAPECYDWYVGESYHSDIGCCCITELGDPDSDGCSSSGGDCLEVCQERYDADSAHCEDAEWLPDGERVAPCNDDGTSWSNAGFWKSCYILNQYCDGGPDCDCVCEVWY